MSVTSVICIILFWLSAFIIIWAMAGYRLSLKILGKVFSKRKLKKDYTKKTFVTVMTVAHNEEKVIHEKLNNMINNDYPKESIEYIVASDCSTDKTHQIVEKFIIEHPEVNMQLIVAKNHKGKTNAQNEAQKFAKGEILVMTDANAMFEKNAISELVACFTEEDIVYVSGKLSYINADDNGTASSENTYWEGDLSQRETESRIRTITAGNGAIYACRNELYYDFNPIECHDSCMPKYYAGKKLRAIYNPDAVAYEKAGEQDVDEFKRKVRMNRGILPGLVEGLRYLNVFKYRWFSYFYFGHRTCRYLLWLAHVVLLIVSFPLSFVHWFYLIAFVEQVLFYATALVNIKARMGNKLVSLISYYSMTVFAQWKGVINCITGKSKPTWESAESTR